MNLYQIDVQICGTVYVKARTLAEANEKLDTWLRENACEVRLEIDETYVSDKRFDSPDLPEISLSPAITLHGVWPGA